MGDEASLIITLLNWQVFDPIAIAVLFECRGVCVIELMDILHILFHTVGL